MYQEFYGLKEKPFALTPDPQFLYLGECHRTAIESLLYGIHQREGFMVIVGDIGTGKTTICRALLGKLDEDVKAAVIFYSFLTEEELLESILQEYGFPSKGRSRKERIDALNTLFLHYLSQNKNALLIIDEAQHLTTPVLEQIRMLSNLETEKEKMLQIILVGQPELDQKLKSAELRQLNQRIAIRHQLLPLTRSEMESYVYQRLQVAGANGSVTFSKSALNDIYKLSKGTPRLINLLCDRSLIGGFINQTHHIDSGIIKKAKKSLSGEDADGGPSRSYALLKFFPSLRGILLMVLFLLAGMMVSNKNQLSPSEAPPLPTGSLVQSGASRQDGIIRLVSPPRLSAYRQNGDAPSFDRAHGPGYAEGVAGQASGPAMSTINDKEGLRNHLKEDPTGDPGVLTEAME
jgi:general secretion pathway protein A